MPQFVVHFEITGTDPANLREFYNGIFGWEFDTDSPVAPAISEEGNYGFFTAPTTTDGRAVGIPGGIGGGAGFESQLTFYVGVPNVEAALRAAESHGGTRVLDPQQRPGGGLVVAHFRDPEGNLVGLAGPK